MQNLLECATRCLPCKDRHLRIHPRSHPPLGLRYSPPPSSNKNLVSGAGLPQKTLEKALGQNLTFITIGSPGGMWAAGLELSSLQMGGLKARGLEDVSQGCPASDMHAHPFQGKQSVLEKLKHYLIFFFLNFSGLTPMRGLLGKPAALCPHWLPSRDHPFQLS